MLEPFVYSVTVFPPPSSFFSQTFSQTKLQTLTEGGHFQHPAPPVLPAVLSHPAPANYGTYPTLAYPNLAPVHSPPCPHNPMPQSSPSPLVRFNFRNTLDIPVSLQ